MRKSLEQIIVAKNKAQQEKIIGLYLQLQSDLAFFTEKLTSLQQALIKIEADKRRELFDEIQNTKQLITTLEAYLTDIEAKQTLYITHGKMTDTDITVLEAQSRGINMLRTAVSSSDDKTDNLSALIESSANMAYSVSPARRWLRRCGVVLTGLVCGAVALATVTAFMTPGVNIVTALLMAPMMLSSVAAFIGLRSPVTTTTQINTGFGPLNIATPVPTTLGVVTSFFMGASLCRKLRLTNPAREEAARNVQTATVNNCIDLVKKKTKNLGDNIKLQEFLNNLIKKAECLYNEGADSWLAETREAKMQKSRLILREIGEILKVANHKEYSVDDAMNRQLKNSKYTFFDLINAQRNQSTFWKKESDTTKSLNLERKYNTKSIHIMQIAKAMG